MVLKKKHSKQLKKNRQKKEEYRAKNGPEIDFDTSAYVVYDRLEMTYPCLTFDIVQDHDCTPDRVTKFPLSMFIVAGAQTPPQVENNYIYVMKVDNIKPLKQEDETVKDEESEGEEEDNDENDPSNLPKLTSVRIAHKGCVNRLRVNRVGGRTLAASWSDKGKVHLYDITTPIQAVADQKSINTYTAQKVEPKPIFTFGGHLSEGFALAWSPLKAGSLASGDCKKNVHLWNMRGLTDWYVDQHPLVGHESSVEDIKWSPDQENVLATCSVDKSIRVWDLRLSNLERCTTNIQYAHNSDVNVIDWNTKTKHLIVSGGDDGVVKVWDTRFFARTDEKVRPVASFDYHKKPITSVEWDPNDDTVMAVSSDDDRLTLWDLAVEKDDEQEQADMEVDNEKPEKSDVKEEKKDEMDEDSESSSDESDDEDEDEDEDKNQDADDNEDGIDYGGPNLKTIPEQMLFLHQGQTEIKELHWHPQLKGLIISTALNGINIFKTISA